MGFRAPLTAAFATATMIAVAPSAAALPECTNTTATTIECQRGTHVRINSAPNVVVNTGPFLERPWLYNPGIGVFGIGGWAVP